MDAAIVQTSQTAVRTGTVSPLLPDYDLLRRLMQTDFLHRCLRGRITRAELDAFALQHYWYLRSFPRFLGALISNLANETDPLTLSRNLFEEMHSSGGHFPQAGLYQKMLQRMALDGETCPLQTTADLVATQLACCRSPNAMIGLGALYLGTEATVAAVYSAIVQGFLNLGEDLGNLGFFTLRIQRDEPHVVSLQRIVARALAHNPEVQADLNYGAEQIIRAQLAFFNGLAESPGKHRPVRMKHCAAGPA